MAQFSGAVKLADLNDFIAPSQACVVNISGKKDGALQLDNEEIITYPEVHPCLYFHDKQNSIKIVVHSVLFCPIEGPVSPPFG